jgi:pimeloyl-ACP methyl ester carboxylesterase
MYPKRPKSPTPASSTITSLTPTSLTWRDAAGEQHDWQQRDWFWRGWQTRYTFLRAAEEDQAGATQPEEPPVPILLLHGFGASIGHWRYNLPVFAQKHPVYALDLIGFGASAKPATTYEIDLWVAQVYAFWRTFIHRPVVLVGNSIGSLAGVGVLAAHPEMVMGLACLSLPDTSIREDMIPAPLRPLVFGLESWVTQPWLLQSLFYWLRRPQVVRPWAKLAYGEETALNDELIDILTRPAHTPGAAQAFAQIIKGMTSPGFGPKVKVVFPKLQVPVLLIWGEQDRMVPPGLGRQFARYSPLVQMLELAQTGHCPHDERPEAVNQAILDWLEHIVLPHHAPRPPAAGLPEVAEIL